MKVEETRDVWVAWTNTDCTEGRGEQVPYAVCKTQTTAKRLGKRKSVQGSDCAITREIGVKVDGEWYYPGRLHYASREDDILESKRILKEQALEKAVAAGLTEEELNALTGR